MTESLTVGSLFAGIGGIELGLEWTGGFRTVWQVERDPYAQRVLAKHWPDAVRHDDVCTVGAHNLTPVDVICGGFPCQDISSAGKGAGIIDGERSGLWREYARIIRELRPRYVLVENVSALLGRGIDVVLGDLAESGYDAEWSVLSAAEVGAPHRRERVFVVAHAACVGRSNESSITDREAMVGAVSRPSGRTTGGHPSARISQRGRTAACSAENVADTESDGRGQGRARRSDSGRARQHITERPLRDAHGEWELQPQGSERQERRRSSDPGWWSVEPAICRVAHGVPARVDRLRALGNAVVPQCAEFVGRRILELDQQLTEGAA